MIRSLQLQKSSIARHVGLPARWISSQPSRRSVSSPRIVFSKYSHGIRSSPRLNNLPQYGSRRRWLSSTGEASAAAATPVTPPLAVRTALVASTTAIGTPAFPVVGVVNLGLRYVVFDPQTRSAILGATTIVGAVYTLVHFATFDLLPMAYSYGQLFLPFAIVNGGLAGAAYLGLDLALGKAQLARLPWTGAAMGAFVGLVGPVSGLYDLAFQWCYDIPEADGWFTYLLSNQFMLPISMATGTCVGLMLHPLLYYPIMGVPGVHWAKLSVPLLAAATLLMGNLYAGDYYNSKIFPPETYLTTDEQSGLMLVPRFHAQHLTVEDWGPKSGYKPSGTGLRARESVMEKLEATKQGSNRTDMVFDSRRKAWLHYVTNGVFGSAYAVETIPSQTEINQHAKLFLPSDGAVAFILLQGGQLHKNQKETASLARDGLTQLTIDLQKTNRRYIHDSSKAKRTVDRIELASHGISLLLTQQKLLGDSKEKDSERLEKDIRKVVPGIILYKTEETDETADCSVESQLESLGWTGIQDDELKKHTSRHWKAGLHHFLLTEQAQVHARQLAWAITGLGVVVLYGLMGSGGYN